MCSRGDLQKRLASVFADVKAQGYKFEEIIPEEMQAHFQEMSELKTAREYIKEVELREKDLEAANNDLTTKLKTKEAELEDQPEEFKAMKTDLKQANSSVNFYKRLYDEATERSGRSERRLADLVKKQTVAEEATRKIKSLQAELEQSKLALLKLHEENRKTVETFDQLRLLDMKIVDENNKMMADALSRAQEVEDESEQFNETFTSLIDVLESENSTAAAIVNDKTTRLVETDRLYSAIVSEVTPLNRFFSRAFSVLKIYQTIFQSLADPRSTSVAPIPPSLNMMLFAAEEDLDMYREVHKVFQTTDIAREQVRGQLDIMASNADKMYTSLISIKADVKVFLDRLHNEPDAWMAMKSNFDIKSQWKRFSSR